MRRHGRRTALALAGLLTFASATAGHALWPTFGGGPVVDGATATAVDTLGNVYVAGEFRGLASFGARILSSEGLSDIYVAKYSSDGALIWLATAGGPSLDRAFDLDVDAGGHAYLTGYFNTSIDFVNDPNAFPGGGLPPSLPAVGGPDPVDRRDGFVARLAPDGAWLWAREFGGTGNDEGWAVAVSPGSDVDPNNPVADGVVVAGKSFCGKLYDEGGSEEPGSLACEGSPRILVARLDTTGAWEWALPGGLANVDEWATDLAIDAGGHVYVGGAYLDNSSIATPVPTSLPFTGVSSVSTLEFQHKYNFDTSSSCYDFGVLEYSSDGSNWYDILSGLGDNDPTTNTGNPARFLQNGYNGTWNGAEQNPLGSRQGWCQAAGSFQQVRVDLSDFTGLSMRFRWRFGSGTCCGDEGWYVDDINVVDGASNVVFTDNVEGGTINWDVFGSSGSTSWAVSTTAASSPTHSWFLPDPGIQSDHILQMNRSLFVPEGRPSYFIAKVGGTETGAPFWQWATPLGSGVVLGGLAVNSSQQIFAAGTAITAGATFGSSVLPDAGAFIARLQDQGATYGWDWAFGADGGEGAAVAAAADGDLFFAGTYSGDPIFSDVQNDPTNPSAGTAPVTLPTANGTDVFLARMNPSGTAWRWVQTATPAPGDDRAEDVATNGGTRVYVAGSFEAVSTFGDVTISSQGAKDAFAAAAEGADGTWFQVDFVNWVVGEEVAPPGDETEFCLDDPTLSLPLIEIAAPGNPIPDYFTWSPPGANADGLGHLYAVQPVLATIKWKKTCNPADQARESVIGGNDWPRELDGDIRYCGSADADLFPDSACVQVHIAGALADIEPPASGISFAVRVEPRTGEMSADASVNPGGPGQAVFSATDPGFSVLIFADHPSSRNVNADPTVIVVVRSLPYNTTDQIERTGPVLEPIFRDSVNCEIGQEIFDVAHQEYGGKNGYVLFDRAYFDGVGPDRAYDRQTRLGQIVPVNRVPVISNGQDVMAVAWYRIESESIAWPARSARYDCQWPANPDKIIIASELGSEVLGQPALDPLAYPGGRIYVQGDDSAPGFNPNDEHALLAPANSSSGFNAIFAVRSDFSTSELAKTSAPYTMLKYLDPGTGIWRYRVYQVLATGAGYETFQYNGTAGTPVFAPYPVRLLGDCLESEAKGRPAFQDYKAQVWAKAAGTLVAEYWYPLQPGFWYDRDGDHTAERTTGECIPWLGGPSDDPVDVTYTISWPDNVPYLVAGETLLTPKFGLPDIYNQAAVEVVFDEKIDRLVQAEIYDPTSSLVRLIDPLSPRSVRLFEIPEDIATDLDPASGLQIPVSNTAGTIKLPATIRDRMTYDPINKKLAFGGIFDESGAGEPLLLLNVLTDTERKRLKTLDGGDGTEEESSDNECQSLGPTACTWDQAIEALYRLTRNPGGLDLDLEADRCTLSLVIDPTTGLEIPQIDCPTPTDGVVDNALLLGLQDENSDGVPEPLQVVGFGPALTAGFAQGTGYLTVAFNNDQSLSPLPVSLNVIRVDCLRIPQDPPPDLLSTYQGQINIIESDNVFDEALTMRHSGDFAGQADGLEFEWFFHPDIDGTPPSPLPDPDNGQLNGWLQFTDVPSTTGAIDITIEGANIQTLSDNWFVVRYRYLDPPIDVGDDGIPGTGDDGPLCGGDWSIYAGQPGSTPTDPRAQLAEGWIKRVLDGLNPFEARVTDFHAAETNTYASMLFQLGERYEGDIAFNPDAGNLNSIGLIEAYQTVLNRGKKLSIDGTPPVDYAPVNNALLLVTSRISDFYNLLGNEAYADAQDPMIGFGTGSGVYGTLAPAVFAFQNQLDSLLEEELVLLRGRDDGQGPVAARPVYNRLFWNFTTGEGEFAYAIGYNITDQNLDGLVDEDDARVLFPQGHGDAWGHYLTAMTTYYELLRHPFFTWIPRPEAVLVSGVPIQVDFLDERKFAKTAAAKAKAGAEIVDLTYRSAYVEDPAGQWQGYKDGDTDRAWGLSEWAKRAGQGAYFDWVVGNAILPAVDPNPDHVGIQQVDRTTVEELEEISAQFDKIQQQVDEADAGLNPLGLAKGVVPFDIDPSFLQIGSGTQGKTHFEQIFERAEKAMDNTVATWNHANQLTELLRRTQDDTELIYSNMFDQEVDYKNRLLEIYGYPYDADIGPTGTYSSGYDGPDVYHYMYVDSSDLTGAEGAEFQIFTATFSPLPAGIGHFDFEIRDPDCTHAIDDDNCSLGPQPDSTLDVDYHVATPIRTRSTANGPDIADSFFLVKPAEWGDSQRRAPGELQNRLSDLLITMNSYRQVLTEYNNLIDDIEDQADLLEATYDVKTEQINIMNGARKELSVLTGVIETLKATKVALNSASNTIEKLTEHVSDCLPKGTVFGLANGGDLLSVARCGIKIAGVAPRIVLDTIADGLEIVTSAMDAAKEDVEKQAEIEVEIQGASFEVFQAGKELEKLLRDEPLKRLEAYERREQVDAARTGFMQQLAEGQRLIAELVQFRKNTAADIQTYRYRDMAFRWFRNDALQKYRAQFDLLARYVYLAATAYDYETSLLHTDNRAGVNFLTSIVKERSIGQIIDGEPVPGSRGLAGPMGQMKQNFEVLKGQLGFNNPQIETNRFSLRREAFRFLEESGEEWRNKLENEWRVDDIWQVPEFRRYCKPFAPESAGPQPALVIPFETTVTFGQNFFGWPLGAGDSFYDSTNFATRVRSVGTWFQSYSSLPLSNTPRVYIVPVGADVLRAPSDDLFTTREWQIVDQALPVPFPLGSADLDDPTWIPMNDTLGETYAKIRRYTSLRAYHTDGIEDFDPSEMTTSSRLIGRSVWNRRWLLIIPGGTLLNDPDEGLDAFIHGNLIPGGGGERDGLGVDDIYIFFQTYAYSGF